MKVQKIKKYGNGLPGDIFYYEFDGSPVVYDSRTEKPAVIYTLNKNLCFRESWYTYELYRKNRSNEK